jgi:hypothetical protein
MPPLVLKAGSTLIPFTTVHHVEIDKIDQRVAVIFTHDGERHEAYGFDAVEAVYALKPTAVEGERALKWEEGSWAFHNIVGHPVMQILAWIGFKKAAIWIHDVTAPEARDFR